eukprot:TRINITY_DN36194_c0_g1_i1.p3 TRINITY_DN36194_c0_g1~~TRINITY_DN36194_c0_g1_i1.p3  ORF type:complete len:105 (+),score=15.70 TRINITY_DN36194_c0_g1_i1:265-579(+)
MGIQSGWATISLILMILSVVSSILIYLWMRFCYYPGGRRREDVIDVAELAPYKMQQAQGEGEDEYYDEAATEYSEGPYEQQRPRGAASVAATSDLYDQEAPPRR